MRVLLVASGRNVPSSRFRMIPFQKRLIELGSTCDIAFSYPPKYESYRWLGWRLSQRMQRTVRLAQVLWAKVRRYDCIVVEREIFHDGSWDIEQRFRDVAPRLVLDVDDGIFLQRPEKYAAIAKMADHVLCGNRFIEAFTQPLNPNTTVLPTCVDEERYCCRPPHAQVSSPTIGWIGTGPNVKLLSTCASVLRALARCERFQLKIIASADAPLGTIDMSGVDVSLVPWSESTEIDELQRCDIGIMPLPNDDPWMQYKCAAKLIQYLAVGLPAVATPIGVNADILEDGSVGFAAANDDDWYRSLQLLLHDAELRQRMGSAGRSLVEKHFTIAANFPKFLEALTGRPSQAMT